jgi:hypothetical protein
MRKPRWIDSGLLLLLLAPGTAAGAPPAVSFEEGAVVVAGVTAGGRVAVLTVERGFRGLIPLLRQGDHLVVDDDGDGEVRVAVAEAMPPRSLAVAVDLGSGELGAAAADGDLVWRELPPRAVGAARRHLEDGRSYLEVLLARPGGSASGAWTGGFGDGSRSDGDGVRDRGVRAAIERLRPVGDSPPTPDRVEVGDVVVVVDPETLELFSLKLRP